MFSLPWELNQLIIDELHDDKRSLLSCCLVSKAAIPHARRHLFLRMTISLVDDKSVRWDRLQTLLRSSTRVGDYVRILRIVHPSYEWFRKSATEFQRIFPCIRELEIREVTWNLPGNSFRLVAGSGGLKSVTRLVFNGLRLWGPSDLDRLISAFPQCDTLVCAYGSVVPVGNIPASVKIPQLRTLDLEGTDNVVLLQWALQRLHPIRITSLTIRGVALEDSILLGRLLKAVGENLRHFKVSLKIMAEVNEIAENIDLRHNTELRSITFDDWRMSFWVQKGWAPIILKSIRSKQLRDITFKFNAPNIETLPWEEAASFFQRGSLRSLECVRFENRHSLTEAVEREYIYSRLPMLAVSGVLQYASTPEGIKVFPWEVLKDLNLS